MIQWVGLNIYENTLNQPLLKEVGYTTKRANWDLPLTIQPNLNLKLFSVL
jgi:hypothetical protein